MCLSEISRPEISPVILAMTNLSGVTSPPTTAEPRPHVASMVITERSPVSGLRVNITPAVRASTIFCTTTAIATPSSGIPRFRRYEIDGTEYRLDQQERTDFKVASTPLTHR